MAVQDRTHEFRTCVDSIRNRSAIQPRAAETKQRLLQSHGKGAARSEFSRMASNIAKEISSMTIRLSKLAQRELRRHVEPGYRSPCSRLVAKRKTLFDDKPVEISVCSSIEVYRVVAKHTV